MKTFIRFVFLILASVSTLVTVYWALMAFERWSNEDMFSTDVNAFTASLFLTVASVAFYIASRLRAKPSARRYRVFLGTLFVVGVTGLVTITWGSPWLWRGDPRLVGTWELDLENSSTNWPDGGPITGGTLVLEEKSVGTLTYHLRSGREVKQKFVWKYLVDDTGSSNLKLWFRTETGTQIHTVSTSLLDDRLVLSDWNTYDNRVFRRVPQK
jgi:hypothetical protein